MQFDYQAKNQNGELIKGKIEAPSEDQAVVILHRKSLIILSLESTVKPLFSMDLLALLNKPRGKDVVMFTRQLATLVDADVPVVEGLRSLASQVEKESFKKVISSITDSIEGGASLSLALSEHENIFGSFYISLIKAGEVSGKLHATLLYLADYLERNAALNSKIRGALSYPIFVLVAMVVVASIMMTTVLPQLLSIIKESGQQDLPVTTKVLMVVTGFFNSYFWFILLFVIAAGIGVYYYIKSEKGRHRWHIIKLKLPQFGKVIRNFYIARLGETLSTLIKSGVPILDGLSITSEVVNNEVYRDIILEARENVRSGGTISEVFQRYSEFPPLVSSMLMIGERTGRTDYMLDNVTKFFKTETENTIQNLTQLIEPILILALGLAVGVLVAAILLPIYNMVGMG